MSKNIQVIRPVSCLMVLLLLVLPLWSQYPGAIDLELADGARISLCRQRASPASVPVYYYLPVNLRISEVDSNSEFSFMAFRQDSLSPISGGLMHLLMVWGLDKEQFHEAETLLRAQTDSTAVLAGSVFLDPDDQHPTVEIISDAPAAELLRRSVKNSAGTPLYAGSKLAISFSFSEADAQKMTELLENPDKFAGIKFRLYFRTNTSAFAGCVPPKFWMEGDFKEWLENLK